MARREFRIHGRPDSIVVDVSGGGGEKQVTIGERTHTVRIEITAPGEGLLHIDHEVTPFYLAEKDGPNRARELHVWLRGNTYVLEPVAATASRSGAAGGAGAFGGEITAPMPGSVLQVKVSEGDAVEANQALVIMESMKMEMTLSAPVAGTVKRIAAREGQLVDMGAVLVELEPES